jgi:hypothetical protein
MKIKMNTKFCAVLAAVICLQVFALGILPARAATSLNYINVYEDYYARHTPVSETVWNGADKMAADTVYVVTDNLLMTANRVIPASSMLVIKEGGSLTVIDGATLYCEGTLGVEYSAVLNLKAGRLVLNSGGTAGVGGSVYVDEESEAKIYSDFMVYMGGTVILSGQMSAINNGCIYQRDSIRTFGGKLSGKTLTLGGYVSTGKRFEADVGNVDYIRFYDYDKGVTYRIMSDSKWTKILEAWNKITIFPLCETQGIVPESVRSYAFRLYDADGNELARLERPSAENDGYICIDYVLYSYTAAGMTFDDLYYYTYGVIEH